MTENRLLFRSGSMQVFDVESAIIMATVNVNTVVRRKDFSCGLKLYFSLATANTVHSLFPIILLSDYAVYDETTVKKTHRNKDGKRKLDFYCYFLVQNV